MTPQTAHFQNALQSYKIPKPLKEWDQNNTIIDSKPLNKQAKIKLL